MKQPKLRLLLVEDDEQRVTLFRHWIECRDITLIHARSAGNALGIISRDSAFIDGIMLDHDLQEQTLTQQDMQLSGQHVTNAIINHIPRQIPVLLHSMNPEVARVMQRCLENAGFAVTRKSMFELNREIFQDWLIDVICEYELKTSEVKTPD